MVAAFLRLAQRIPPAIEWRAKRFWHDHVRPFPLAAKHRMVLGWRGRKERRMYLEARRSACDDFTDPNALVSVCVATWNRGQLLCDVVLPAVLAQTHKNLEIIVVGDCCDDDTFERLGRIADDRLRSLNLSERGVYPSDPVHRHMVAGIKPSRMAYELASGAWIAHLDDDEIWARDHVESLLAHAIEHNLELVWGKTLFEIKPGVWESRGRPRFRGYDMPHSSVMLRRYLRVFEPDPNAWRLQIGADRHRFIRMHYAGVRGGFLDQVVTHAPLRPGTTRQWAVAEDRERLGGGS